MNKQIEQIVKEGGHVNHNLSNKETINYIKSITHEMMMNTGINTVIGYEGIESNTDLIFWLACLNNRLKR